MKNRNNPTTGSSEWITAEQASAILGVGRQAMARWGERGIGPQRFRIGLKLIRYNKSEVLEYLQNLPKA